MRFGVRFYIGVFFIILIYTAYIMDWQHQWTVVFPTYHLEGGLRLNGFAGLAEDGCYVGRL